METKEKQAARITAEQHDADIDNLIILNLEYYKSEGPAAIDARIAELDREWDVERTLEVNAAAFAVMGTVLGAVVGKRWLMVPLMVAAFLGQHAVQGWCPPASVLRRMGVRTRSDIDREKYALKALRGDFGSAHDSAGAWAAVTR